MNNQLTKSLSLILGLAIVGSVAFGIEKVYAEEAQTSTKILAQLPSPVRRVNNPRAFVEECKIKLFPNILAEPKQPAGNIIKRATY